MSIKITKQDILWNYLGNILKYGINIIVLPILLRSLNSKEMAVWYVFTSLGALSLLLDFGFAPTLMRNFSYSWGGAKEIKKEGVSTPNEINGVPNYELLYKLIHAAKRIYRYLAIVSLIGMLSIGSIYIYSIAKTLPNINTIIIAWIIYCCACSLNFYYSYLTDLLIGTGKIKDSQVAIVLANIVYLIILVLGLYFKLGLIALASAFLVNGLLIRIISKKFFYTLDIKKKFLIYKQSIRKDFYKEVIKVIWPNTYKLGLVSLGSYLIVQSNTIICSKFLDLQTTASYGLALQFFNLISSFSIIVFRSYLPLFNEARLNNNKEKLKKYFSTSIVVSWIMYISAGLIFVLFGEFALKIIGSNTHLFSKGILAFMLLYLFLEFNHSTFATFITTSNEVPFVLPALLSGLLVVTFSLVLVKFTHLGIWALLISQCVVQLLYNNWKWPLFVLNSFDITLKELFLYGFKNIYLKMRKID